MGQVQPQHHVARLQRRKVDRRVGLGAGVWLHVGMFGMEQFLGAIAGEVLDHVDELAAAVISPAGIALGIFIGQHAAHGLHDRGAGVVFAGNHFQAVALALDFAGNGCPNLRVLLFDPVHGSPFEV